MDFMERLARYPINHFWVGGFFFLLIGCNQLEGDQFISLDDPHLKKLKGVYYFDDTPYTGTLVEIFSNGDTSSMITLKDGIRNGITKKWWQNGHLKMNANFENGLYDGRVEEWYENGARFSSFHYKNGKEDGKQKGWEINGDIKFNYEVIGNRKYGLTGVKHCTNDWVD